MLVRMTHPNPLTYQMSTLKTVSTLVERGISLPIKIKIAPKSNIVGVRDIWIDLAYPSHYEYVFLQETIKAFKKVKISKLKNAFFF